MDCLHYILLGVYFCIVGLWWTVMAFYNHVGSKVPDRVTRRKPIFSSRTWYNLPFPKSQKFAIDPVVKMILSLTALVIQLNNGHWTLFDSNGQVIEANIGSFSSGMIFAMFALTAFVELQSSTRRGKTPRGFAPLSWALTFLCEGTILLFHREQSKTTLLGGPFRELLYMMAFFAAIVTVLELWRPGSFYLNVSRCFFTLLQATWCFQIAYSLRRHHPQRAPEPYISLIPLFLILHAGSLYLFLMMSYFVVGALVRKQRIRKDQLFDRLHNHKNREDIPLSIVLDKMLDYSDESETN